jgi:anti-sigma factor RsiW
MTCPPFETLSAYADRRAAAEEAAGAAAHLRSCAACAASFADLGAARRALAGYAVPPAPAGLAAGILAAARRPRPWWRAFLDELAAGLAQPAGAAAVAALALAVYFAWRAPVPAVETAEAPLEVPAEVLAAAHRRYALSMPLAPVESAAPPVLLKLAGGPEVRDVY